MGTRDPRTWRLDVFGAWVAMAGAMFPHPGGAQQVPGAGGGSAVELTVSRAVDLALERNEQVVAAAADVDRTRGQVEETHSLLLPSLDFSFNYARNLQRPTIFFNQGGETQQIAIGDAHDNAFSLNLRQTVFDPSLPAAVRAAKRAEGFARATEEDVRRLVALNAKTAYFTVLRNRELVEVQASALAQADARLVQVRERAQAGLASEFDTLTALVERNNIEPSLIEARNELQLSADRLKRVLGLPLTRDITLTDSLAYPANYTVSEEEVDTVLDRRPDVTAARRQVDLMRASLDAQRWNALPTVSLTAGLQRRATSHDMVPQNQDFTQSFVVGAQLEWSLFDGRANSGRVLQSRAQLRQAQARADAVLADARLEVQQARQGLEAARSRVQASRGNIMQAERALQIAQQRFASGLSTQLELGEAELQLTRARTNLAQALYAFNVAMARWDAATEEGR